MLQIEAAALTDVGKERDHNEDRVLVRDDLGLYLLADGAGGHNAGDVAASLALQSMVNYFEATRRRAQRMPSVDRFGLATQARRLSAAVLKANADVIEISKKEKRFKGMGTTVVGATIEPEARLIHVAHVGDSRCYRLRAGYVDQLTDDHSLLNDVLEERPEIDDSIIERLPSHVVTRALGMTETLRVSVRSFAIAPGDRYLLCSDGLTGPIGNREIGSVLADGTTTGGIARGLVEIANRAGGPDNIAVVVIECLSDPDEARVSIAAPPSLPPYRRDGSQPEILILGIEEVSLDGEPDFAVVPSQPEKSDLILALGDLIGPPGIKRPRKH